MQAPLGRPRRFCKQSCRQRAFEARDHARRLGVDDSKVIVDRASYDNLLDRRHELSLALADVAVVADEPSLSPTDAAEQLRWLRSHVEALLAVPVEPT